MNIDYIALGKRIREARKNRNMTQEKLGELCGLSSAHIGHIERGTRVPSLETVFRISQELNVSLDYLLFDSKSDENLFSSISASLQNKDPKKVKSFLAAVKALYNNIDGL